VFGPTLPDPQHVSMKTMTLEPRHRFLLKRRIAFEILQEAALDASNSISPRLDLLHRLSTPASEEFHRLESALQLAATAKRAIENGYREAWANEPAPTEAQRRALSLLDRKVSRWSPDLAAWIESEINERNFGVQVGKTVGDWIEWNFGLDVEVVVSALADPDLAKAISRPRMRHRIPSGRVRTLVLFDDRHWDSLIQFDRYANELEVVSPLTHSAAAAASSDLVKELLLFVPELAYLAEWVEAIRLRSDKRQLDVLLAAD
jgi:hypothetical protein